ncbi:MAG TPA: hypothetical protein VM734_26240 [Kofleriaceae bacterium]|jgi:hypothetical protein|nr:hypothetical protein [Kofleriaceae bacterium]
MAVSYGAGQAVEVERDGHWYRGHVISVHEDGSYRVHFDAVADLEDLDEDDVDVERLRAVGARVTAPAPLTRSNPPAPFSAALATDAPSWAHAPRPELEQRLDDILSALAAELRAGRGADPARDRAAMRKAIAAFYDVRAAAGQPRGMYATHFFWADGVGLDARHRHLHERLHDVDRALVDRWAALFDEVVPSVK